MAALPALVLVTLVAAQLALVGYSLWGAGVAARAGARAAYVGEDAERTARASLPVPLRERASVSEESGVRVRVRAPSLILGLPRVPLTARASLGAGAGDGR